MRSDGSAGAIPAVAFRDSSQGRATRVLEESALTIRRADNPPSGEVWKPGGRDKDEPVS